MGGRALRRTQQRAAENIPYRIESPGPDSEYHYDPYGELDDPDPEDSTEPEELLSGEAKQNPFRFEGFYYDSAVKTYDMQAREYLPQVGRFLSADRFEAAGMDLALQSDPLTQNRYAFAGGNPVSMIEWDGHDPCCIFSHTVRSLLCSRARSPGTLRAAPLPKHLVGLPHLRLRLVARHIVDAGLEASSSTSGSGGTR